MLVRLPVPLGRRHARHEVSAQLDLALGESAMAAIRCKDTYLAAQYLRLRSRCGHRKALGAVKHSTICTHRGAAGRAAGLRSPPRHRGAGRCDDHGRELRDLVAGRSPEEVAPHARPQCLARRAGVKSGTDPNRDLECRVWAYT
jgi:hypothetical protein